MKKKHINNVQTSMVNEHYELLLKDKNLINSKFINTATLDDLPDWYDEKLFREAQNYYKRNMVVIVLTSFMGLFAIISIPDILKVLIYTKKSNMPYVAFNRYVQTLLHIHNLYTCNPNNSNSNWYKTINRIRWQHKTNSKRSINANIGGIYEKNMALTQFAFVGYVLTAPKSVGLRNTLEEEEAFIHLWRVVGYMLGIPDKLNICRKTVEETRELCQKISNGILVNYLNEAPSDFYSIVSSITHGLWYIDLTLDKDALLAFTYRLHGIKYNVPLKWYSWLNMNYRDLILYLCLVPYVGTIVKIYYNYLLMFTLWLVQKWPIHAWISFGKEKCQIKLYPN
ncbi:uncharacterized protein LOC105253868 isoform X1 [Camponotus floridanus]|uniref:uncharacterized protein LOC105253868 isoform X1 n=2 Tax=Camponotus floridanus TaxID=104421 RepID=UPI000DC6A8CC|nr:uncharacterized protein LOC105253868 isoform X1 [Camponotus floridanus]